MSLIDAYIVRRYAASYLCCLASLVLLFIVLDVFTKIDEFTAEPEDAFVAARAAASRSPAESAMPLAAKKPKVRVGPIGFLRNVGGFYVYRLPVIFDQLNGLLVLLAAAFTLGWMEKQNELLPLLAAGVRMRRLFLPAWCMALAFLALGALNREALIPVLAPDIMRKAEDPQGRKPVVIQGGFDQNGVHLDGKAAYAERRLIMQGRITLPAAGSRGLTHLACQEMYWRPARGGELSGWQLNGVKPDVLDDLNPNLRPL